MGVYRGIWTLMEASSLSNMVEEAAIDGRKGASTSTVSENFHILPWKLPITSMEVNVLPTYSMEVGGSFHGSKFTSMKAEENLLPWEISWKWVETSMEVDRMEVDGPLWTSYGSS